MKVIFSADATKIFISDVNLLKSSGENTHDRHFSAGNKDYDEGYSPSNVFTRGRGLSKNTWELFLSKYFSGPEIDISARGTKITTKDIHRQCFYARTRFMNILAKIL